MHGSGREPTISRGCACTMSLPSSSCIRLLLIPDLAAMSRVLGFSDWLPLLVQVLSLRFWRVRISWFTAPTRCGMDTSLTLKESFSCQKREKGHLVYSRWTHLKWNFEERERERFKEDVWREEEMPFSHILIPYQGERQSRKKTKQNPVFKYA